MNCTASQSLETGGCPIVLEAKALCKRFGGADVLRGVDLALHSGEVVLLRGPNGAGKTTLINILTGHLEADAGEITIRTNGSAERFSFPFGFFKRLNPFLHFLPERVAREGVMRTWQDSRLFPSLALAENIAVAAPNHPGQNPLNLFFRPRVVRQFEDDAILGAARRLDMLQLGGRDASSGGRISLGQTKRVAIAQALNAQARILFFDEPLAGLDAQGIRSVVEMLQTLAQDHGISIVVVEHQMNAPHILRIANTVWTLEKGSLQSCPAQEVASKQETDTNIFTSYLEENSWRIHREEPLPRGAHFRVYRHFQNPISSQNTVLGVQNLAVRRGERWIIGRSGVDGEINDTLSFQLKKGDLGVLLAPNGWGKTTALDAIAGLIPIEKGDVWLNDTRMTSLLSWKRFTGGLHYVRACENTFPNLTVAEHGMLSSMSADSIRPDLLRRTIGSLSGGERQGLLLSRTFGEVTLLDEPFKELDSQRVESLLAAFTSDTAQRRTCLFAVPKNIGL